jgi:hypothetical protein
MRFCCHAGVPLLLLIGFLSARPDPAFADQVVLTYGDHISGRIISVSKDAIRIETPASGIIDIERKYVEQLSTEEPRIVDLLSGERIIGRLIAAGGKRVIIRSSILGDLQVSLDTIDSVRIPVQTDDRTAGTMAGQRRNSASAEPVSLPPTEENGNAVLLAQIQGMGTGSSGPEQKAANAAQAQQPKSIGQKPEDVGDIRKIFLRQFTVLLRPRQVETEAAFNYQHTQAVSAIVNARYRQFQLPLAFRVGLFNRAEGYVTIPVTYARRELGFADSVVSHKKAGIGDATAGLNYELAQETATRPDIIASVALGTPTGSKPNEQGLSLGTGHWTATVGFQFIKIVDPIALFGGLNYAHQFKARYFLEDAVHNVDPGEIAGYNFGFGFAVNENVSLSAQVIGSYQSDTKADGRKIFASSSEPASLRSALTYRYSKGTYIEPSVTIGLDEDTPDFALGLSLTHRFGK